MTDELPKTFEELLALPEIRPTVPCQRCGKPSTHRVTLSVSKTSLRLGKSRGGPQPGTQIAKHYGSLCESCAVIVFAKFREVIH